MKQKSVTNQSNKAGSPSFTIEDIWRVTQKINSNPDGEQKLKVTPLEYAQLVTLAEIRLIGEIHEHGQKIFGVEIEVDCQAGLDTYGIG